MDSIKLKNPEPGKCINFGCNRKQEKTNKKNEPVRYRPFCSKCHGQHIEGKPLDPGIDPFRQNKCENLHGALGFPCITDHSKIGTGPGQVNAKGKFEIDHKDGNSTNNEIENLQELCTHCHREKTIRNGDGHGNKYKIRDRAHKNTEQLNKAGIYIIGKPKLLRTQTQPQQTGNTYGQLFSQDTDYQ